MAAKAVPWTVMVVVIMGAVVACVGADMDADRSECAEQLVGLAPCLQYVQGQARSPAPDCCGGLSQVLDKSPKCLCVLVKDKDDPNLGIKINASLALALPSACGNTKANVSHCPRTSPSYLPNLHAYRITDLVVDHPAAVPRSTAQMAYVSWLYFGGTSRAG